MLNSFFNTLIIMLEKIIFYTLITFSCLLVQLLVSYIFSKNKPKLQLNENLISIIGASLFFGIMFTLISKISSQFNLLIISFILFASTISSYWFIINPLKYLFFKNKYSRDFALENELETLGYHYKILFTNQIKSNALATGIVPFYKTIIISNNLKDELSKTQLLAIIFHEIGHHEKRHILKLFFVNTILQSLFFLMFFMVNKINFDIAIFEPLSVAIVGGIGGFIFWYVPSKISFIFEYQADKYSANYYNKDEVMIALSKLDEISGGELSKGNYSHPNLQKRLNNLKNN